MKHALRWSFTSLVVGVLLASGCLRGNDAGGGGTTAGGAGSGGTAGSGGGGGSGSGGSTATGGRGGSGGTAGSGGGGVGGSGGGSGGTAGSGGSLVGTGGRGGGGGTVGSGGTSRAGTGGMTASGGTTAATGGTSAGTDGGTASTGGRGGTGGVGTGGRGGGSGQTGGTGGGGGAGGGTAAGSGDDYVSGVKVEVHAQTKTILVVTWTQAKAADSTFLEFSFSGSGVMTSRAAAGATGAHRDVVLGVPASTAVTIRIVSRLGGVDYKTKDYQGTTGALPSGLPLPTVLAYDATLASPERWMLGSVVQDDAGGCGQNPSCYYVGTFWIYVMDHQGRIVWYWADPSSSASSAHPRVARDGEYIVIDKGRGGATGVVKMTLDRQYYETIAIAQLDDAIDVTSDGGVLYDAMGELRERNKAGTVRTIWSCAKQFGANFECYSNTVNWNPADDTVMLSFPGPGTAVQINRKTGAVVGQYGNASGSYAFSPSSWKFQYPHNPVITPQGTLLVSTHLPAFPFGTPAAPKQHAFAEFEIDHANKKLTEKWVYSDGTEWAMIKGMAIRLANGNTLGNYGSGGVIREITPDKQTVFHVKFDVATGADYFNRMVGNNVYVDDLYALNGGGPK